MSSSEHEVGRYQKKEAYNHELVTSEDFYVSEIEALMTHIVTPLQANACRCNIKSEEVDFVFGTIGHILQFHIQFLRIIRDELSCIHTFCTYIAFLTMYRDYHNKYNLILDIVSQWSFSMQFREFMHLRLQNEKCQKYIDNRLCSIPWYLYRPFERIKQYHRFLKDLETITYPTDDHQEYKALLSCKNKIKSLYDKINKSDLHFIKKTRLLEIQLQIFGNTEPIVNDERYFVYNRICQLKLNGTIAKKTKKYKHIHLYIFNDQLLWCSKRGRFKRSFKFINTNLVYGIPDSSGVSEATLFLQYGSSQHQKHHRKHQRKKGRKISTIYEHKKKEAVIGKEEDIDWMDKMEINHGKATKKVILIFVNEQARDHCLQKIKQTQSKYIRRLQRKREKKLRVAQRKHKYQLASSTEVSVSSCLTETQTEDSSFISGMEPMNNMNICMMKPLETHNKYASQTQLSTPTMSQMSNITLTMNESDETDGTYYSEENSFEHSKSKTSSFISNGGHSQNGSISISNNVNKLKQSVSTEIHTIKEEDEDDVKAEPE